MNLKLDLNEQGHSEKVLTAVIFILSTEVTNLAYRMEKIQLMLLSLRTLGIKSDVRRLFVHDNRMFAERAFYCIQKKFSRI